MPKPLVEVGGRPILWHVMKIYAHHGFTDFVLALGYLGHKIKEYFLRYEAWRTEDFRFHFDAARGEGEVEPLREGTERWHILFADTGQQTPTGGRIKLLEPYLQGDTFLATYADGVADLDLRALLDFHRAHGRLATLTAVRPISPFGLLDLAEDGCITRFLEKPRMEQWINGGFFVFERGVLDYLRPNSVLEREPFERLATEGQIYAYQHTGFWACMDTYKDTEMLNRLWETGQAPWKIWDE